MSSCNCPSKNSSSGLSLNSFLCGALIGGGLVFILGTKKGKKLLRTILDEGFDNVSKAQDLIEEVKNELELDKEGEKPNHKNKEIRINGETVEEILNKTSNDIKEQTTGALDKIAKSTKKFFKGIPRRS